MPQLGNGRNEPKTDRSCDDEVKEVVFQLGAMKAPGPDGMNGQFYQHHWEDLQQDVFNMVKNFFETSILDPTLNKTHISLIPKVQNPERLDQFRPISLCNFAYKMISKVMTNRLKPSLPELIVIEQVPL